MPTAPFPLFTRANHARHAIFLVSLCSGGIPPESTEGRSSCRRGAGTQPRGSLACCWAEPTALGRILIVILYLSAVIMARAECLVRAGPGCCVRQRRTSTSPAFGCPRDFQRMLGASAARANLPSLLRMSLKAGSPAATRCHWKGWKAQ